MQSHLPSTPSLFRLCNQMHQEIVTLSGLSKGKLEDVSNELEIDYEVWCSEYQGPTLADTYMGFREMLRHWSPPWPCFDGSQLNGLTIAQIYLGWAYGKIEHTINLLANDSTTYGIPCHDAIDHAASSAICAAKALTHAKDVLGSRTNFLAQGRLSRI